MRQKIAIGIMLAVLLISMLTSTLSFQLSEAENAISSEPVEMNSVWMGTDWNKTYGGTKGDFACSVVQLNDGGYVMGGQTSSYGAGSSDFWLVKTAANGTIQWSKTYGGTGGDLASFMIQTVDGGYAIGGSTYSFGAGQGDFWLVKTDAFGSHEWNQTCGGAKFDFASDAVQTSDGGYALAGYTLSYGAGGYDIWLVKTYANGTVQWSKTYGGTSDDLASSVVQTSDGGYALAGRTKSYGAGSSDFWLVKTAANGTIQWSKTYGGASYDEAHSLVQTSDGGYAVAGDTYSFGAGDSDSWLVKIDSFGNVQWNRTYGGTDTDYAYDIVQTGDHGYAMAGSTHSYGAGKSDFWLVKTAANGTIQWSKTYGGASYDEAIEVVQTSDGGYAVAGDTYSFGAGDYDLWLVKLTPQTIYIRADGSVDPPTAPIQRNGDLYTLTDDIYTETDGIVIERNNVTLDGAGYILHGSGGMNGISLPGNYGITIKNMEIKAFYHGIYLFASSQNRIFGNSIALNYLAIFLNFSSNNLIFHNNFVNNTQQVNTEPYANVWDDGYPSGGNYWSDYSGTDVYSGPNQDMQNKDGIGDTPYLIDANNQDNYPLMSPWPLVQYTLHPWTMFRHNLKHTGYTESPAPNTNQTLWTYTTGSYVQSSSPAVADGKVYVGSLDNKVYCLNALTGAHVWSYTTGDDVYSSPAVADGKVYVGSSDSKVYCLNASTGAHIWNYTTGYPVLSSPAVADGKVYVGSWDNVGSGHSKVYCLNALTGAHIWNYTISYPVISSPAVADGKVYVGSLDTKVYCLNASTGAHIWDYTAGDAVWSSPAVADGKVFIGSDKLYCLNALTGAHIWNHTTGSVVSSPAVADGKVYVGSSDSKVYCLDASTGAHIWNYTTGSYVESSPAVADGKVYVGSDDFKVYCLNASTGAHIWDYTTGDEVVSSPAVADGVVYVGSRDHNVYAFGNVIRVPEDYPTVQGAINHATAGATIIIEPGVYKESIVIDKPLTILGKKGSSTTFAGGGSGIAIRINSTAPGTTIANFVITYYDKGVYVNNTHDCKIYDNIMFSMVGSGILVQGNNAANNLIKNNIIYSNNIAINLTQSATSNTIYNNTISSNSVGLNLQSGGNIIYGNTISGNNFGIKMSNSDNNVIYWNSFVNNFQVSIQTAVYGNVWDNGYPSGGNYWSDYTGEDANGDGIGDTPYVIYSGNQDNYPLMNPIHEITIASVTTSKTVVELSFSMQISITIANKGRYEEGFKLTLCADTTIIVKLSSISLRSGDSSTVTFTWNTAGFAKGNYTISAVADAVLGETHTTDNTLIDNWVIVAMIGDVNGPTGWPDGKCDIRDVAVVAKLFGVNYPDPRYKPNYDITGQTTGVADGKIDIRDVALVAKQFGKIDP